MAAYRYWRIFCTATNGSQHLAIQEMELFDDAGAQLFVPTPSVNATASSSSDGDTVPLRAFDGNYTTNHVNTWISDGVELPHWLAFDMGAQVDIQILRIYPQNSSAGPVRSPRNFIIQVRNSVSDPWINLAKFDNVTGWVSGRTAGLGRGFQVQTPAPLSQSSLTARHWRIFCEATGGSEWFSVQELELFDLYGNAITIPSPTTNMSASNTFTSYIPQNAVDGDKVRGLYSGGNGQFATGGPGFTMPQWLAWDMNAPTHIASMRIYSSPLPLESPRDFRIQFRNSTSEPWITAKYFTNVTNWFVPGTTGYSLLFYTGQDLVTTRSNSVGNFVTVEGGSLAPPSTTMIRYGTPTAFVEQNVTGTGVCDATFFGSDPAPGAAKMCTFGTPPPLPPLLSYRYFRIFVTHSPHGNTCIQEIELYDIAGDRVFVPNPAVNVTASSIFSTDNLPVRAFDSNYGHFNGWHTSEGPKPIDWIEWDMGMGFATFLKTFRIFIGGGSSWVQQAPKQFSIQGRNHTTESWSVLANFDRTWGPDSNQTFFIPGEQQQVHTATNWRIIQVDSFARQTLSISSFYLQNSAGARVDSTAIVSTTIPPLSGEIGMIQDASTSVATWDRQRYSVPSFSINWVFANPTEVASVQIGTASSRNSSLASYTLQFSTDNGVTWNRHKASIEGALGPPFIEPLTNFQFPFYGDPFWNEVAFVSNFNGLFQAPVTPERIGDAKGNVITIYGDCQISGDRNGRNTLFCAGGMGNGVQVAVPTENHPLNITTGDFTIETWVYVMENTPSVSYCIFDFGGGFNYSHPNIRLTVQNQGRNLEVALRSSNRTVSDGTPDIANFVPIANSAPGLNTWFHVALTRQGDVFRLWCDGLQVYTVSSSLAICSTALKLSGMNIGSAGRDLRIAPAPSDGIRGHFDNFRVTRACRYTQMFQPLDGNFPNFYSVPLSSSVGIQPLPGVMRIIQTGWGDEGVTEMGTLPGVMRITQTRQGDEGVAEMGMVTPIFAVRDVQYGGKGRILGTVKIKGSPDTPTQRRVRLIREIDSNMIREMWSDPITGVYDFIDIDENVVYTVLSYDHTGAFNAVVASGQIPTLMM